MSYELPEVDLDGAKYVFDGANEEYFDYFERNNTLGFDVREYKKSLMFIRFEKIS